MGFRYILHDKRLLGKPDLVFPKYHAVIFIHGCFWHGHDCHLFKWPKTRKKFWRMKILGNRARDEIAIKSLSDAGWRICTVWECRLKNQPSSKQLTMCNEISTWLKSRKLNFELQR